MKPRILFVCSRNQWRSPTAETIYRRDPRVEARSAGVSSSAKHTITESDLAWADLVFVMEPEHKRRIVERFRHLDLPQIECLEIPDDFPFMNEELQTLIRKPTEAWLKELLS